MTDTKTDPKAPSLEDGFTHFQKALDDLKKGRNAFHAVYSTDLDRLEHLDCMNLCVAAMGAVENFLAKARNVMIEAEKRRQSGGQP